MNIKNKTLIIHDDLQNNQTTTMIVEEKDIVLKTKEFLKKIAKTSKKAAVSVYYPLGIILKSVDEDKSYAVAYEKEQFVIVAPNGTTESAKLYGNWDEAIICAQRILNRAEKKTHFLLAQYVHESK